MKRHSRTTLLGRRLEAFYSRSLAPIALVISLLLQSGPLCAEPIQLQHYDEVYDENGHVREPYREIVKIRSQLDEMALKTINEKSRQTLNGHHPVSPMPRVLSRTEFDSVLRTGVEQRGRAMIAFLQDLYSGRKEFLSDPNLMSMATLQRILKRHNAENLRLNPDSINISYGGDLMRDETGQWRVVEDNIGSNLGGISDLKAHQDALLTHVPGMSQTAEFPDPLQFYRDRVEYFNSRKASPDSIVVNLQMSGDRTQKLRGYVLYCARSLQLWADG